MSKSSTLASDSSSRLTAFLWVTLAYVVSLVVALAVGYWLGDENLIYQVGMADVAATVAIFAFSVIFRNSSFYDPYWSVAPIVIALYLIWQAGETVFLRQALVLILVSIWGVRLTFNWARGWTGLDHEDWRYIDLAKSSGKLYWLVSFSGIHMFPTLLVFAGCLSLFPALTYTDAQPFGWLDIAAALVTGGAILIEAVADNQLRRFKRRPNPQPGEILKSGLWAWSRHPNYFGEISFWAGLFLFALAADPGAWWTAAGPVVMVGLFLGISIPMMDKHMLARRPHYAEHKRQVSALFPWFPKKSA